MAKPKNIAEIKDGAVYILQPGTPIFVKTPELCRMFGKSNQWIGQLTNQGTINKQQTAHGALYPLVKTVNDYIQYLEDKTEERDGDDEKSEKIKNAAEALLKKSKAVIADLDAKERQGKMHRSEDVAAMTEDLVYAVRSALLALPGRLAVDVIAAKDSAEASDIITREVYKIMEELANYEYDPAKYEERVRERLKLEAQDGAEDDE